MMRTIHKYLLDTSGATTLQLPSGSSFRSIQVQRGWPILWAEVDTDLAGTTRTVIAVMTGQPLPDLNLVYLETVQLSDGNLVLHYYEVLQP